MIYLKSDLHVPYFSITMGAHKSSYERGLTFLAKLGSSFSKPGIGVKGSGSGSGSRGRVLDA